jgi:hypothetical protein
VRSRFLPFVVGGGSLSCGYFSVVVAKKSDLGAVYGAAVTAGILAGLTVGWVLLALDRRRVERSAIGRRRTDLALVLLTVPAPTLSPDGSRHGSAGSSRSRGRGLHPSPDL